MPRGAESLTVDSVAVGKPIGKAWMRLFGLVPFDYDRLTIAELQPGRGFREESTMLSIRQWHHERRVTPDDSGKTQLKLWQKSRPMPRSFSTTLESAVADPHC